MSPGTLGDPDEVVAHEFFHAVQDAIGAYDYATVGWWHEATASWIEGEIFPDRYGYVVFLPGFALLPELPVDHFDYPDEGVLAEYHQYGAAIFARYLSEHAADADFVQRTWMEAPSAFTSGSSNPLQVIDDLAQTELDTTAAAMFLDFAERNAEWDYEHGDVYRDIMASWPDFWEVHRPTDTVVGDSGGWVDVDDLAPATYGANYIRLSGMPASFELELEMDELPELLAVTLIPTGGIDVGRTPIEVVEGRAAVTIEDFPGGWLVVAAVDGIPDRSPPTFPYRFQIIGEADPPSTWEGPVEEPRACGCDLGGGSIAFSGAWLGLIVARRRRRA